jgi:hypothetical protein
MTTTNTEKAIRDFAQEYSWSEFFTEDRIVRLINQINRAQTPMREVIPVDSTGHQLPYFGCCEPSLETDGKKHAKECPHANQ